MKKIAAVVMALTLSGCASMFSGSSQTTAINTNPKGARCELIRNGVVIASVANTPGNFSYKKSKVDAQVKCTKPGYQEATAALPSDTDAWTFVNLVLFPLGTVIGVGIDAGTGAINKYDEAVTITLPAAAPDNKAEPTRTIRSKPNS